jgi:hypothetical protein
MKVTDKLKQLIFKHLYKELGNAEIIPYNDSIWFIDRENVYWYFQLSKEGCLYWRYSFFPSFFNLFSLEQSEFEPIISEWVEEVLNHKVSTTKMFVIDEFNMVKEVLDSKVLTTVGFEGLQRCGVEEILDYKVSETFEIITPQKRKVKKVLDSRVSTTKNNSLFSERSVEEVLNSVWVKKALNNKKENESNR